MFARPFGEKPLRIAAREPELGNALERNQPEDDDIEDQAAWSSSPAQVKPAPKAVIRPFPGRPRAISRSSTNSTAGALMLPESFSTSRSRLSSPWLSLSALS